MTWNASCKLIVEQSHTKSVHINNLLCKSNCKVLANKTTLVCAASIYVWWLYNCSVTNYSRSPTLSNFETMWHSNLHFGCYVGRNVITQICCFNGCKTSYITGLAYYLHHLLYSDSFIIHWYTNKTYYVRSAIKRYCWTFTQYSSDCFHMLIW